MTQYARIVNNIAEEVFTPPEGFGIEDCFHPVIVAQFEPVPDDVIVGSVRTGPNAWVIVPPKPDAAEPAEGEPSE